MLWLLVGLYLALAVVDRIVLFVWSPPAQGARWIELPLMLLVGALYDLIAVSWFVLPATLWSLLAPQRVMTSGAQRWITRALVFVFLGLILFNTFAGWVFWEEFTARYNFIAVDYLVYTTEVLDNINESYPMVGIIGGLVALTALSFWALRGKLRARLQAGQASRQMGGRLALVPLLVVPAISWLWIDDSLATVSNDRYRNEIAKDSLYSLMAAFRSNVLDFETNFAHLDEDEAYQVLRENLAPDGLAFASEDVRDLRRIHVGDGEEKRLNVMVICVESLSASFLDTFVDDGKDLTPYLDQLANEGLVYTEFYATGGRTVRGLEALSLSVPPTPGRSIVKRPGNEGLDSIAWPFVDRGYDLRFMYGGHGYFDNMNYFFSSNGFDIVDRSNLADDEVRFANAWGVSDEDIFARAIKESDASAAAGKPFFNFIMTTSNHRPYTYPDVVEIPSGTGRDGAVQYTDHAIRQLIEDARSHAWFDDTIFVVVGDHCASSAGRRDLNVAKHHIPLILYSPKHIAPRHNPRVASQIDFAPTLLGLLNFDYTARFFGHDLEGPGSDRALIGNYQTLGLLQDSQLSMLKTRGQTATFAVSADNKLAALESDDALDASGAEQTAQANETDGVTDAPVDPAQIRMAIGWYQTAAASFLNGGLSSGRTVEAERR